MWHGFPSRMTQFDGDGARKVVFAFAIGAFHPDGGRVLGE